MSLTPEPAVMGSETGTRKTWARRLLHLCLALFTLEIGLFLVIFPWTDRWEFNYFQDAIPALSGLWDEPSFRGALTGLGLVNVYIACWQVLQALRRG